MDGAPIDRAVRAFLRHMGIPPEELVPMVGGRPIPAEQAYRLPVQAAILALRDPDEFMMKAGGATLAGKFVDDPMDMLTPELERALKLESDPDSEFDSAEDRLAPYAASVWQAMIDDVLDEGDE